MKYDLMLIGPATRDINIDYTGQEVREIGGAVFFCAYAAAAASANLFASVKIHPDDTDVLDAFHLDSDHIAVLPAQCTTLMQNTYFTADRERRKAECLAQSDAITPDQIPDVDASGIWGKSRQNTGQAGVLAYYQWASGMPFREIVSHGLTVSTVWFHDLLHERTSASLQRQRTR
mgnify:CR=1 FL=1